MKNLFVPDELSLLAQKKGFDEKCFAIFDNEGFRLTTEPLRNSQIEGNHWRFAYPLYQQLIDWFDQKEIHIYAFKYNGNWHWKIDVNNSVDSYSEINGDRYEALNQAFKRAFNLIS